MLLACEYPDIHVKAWMEHFSVTSANIHLPSHTYYAMIFGSCHRITCRCGVIAILATCIKNGTLKEPHAATISTH
jgi:uncharacterized membrane protein (DUF2068 family)